MVVVVSGSIRATSGTIVLLMMAIFTLRRVIGDDGKLRNVRGGAGGRRDADQGREWKVDPVDPLELEDVSLVGADDADPLGAVHGAAAADGDDGIAVLLPVELGPGHDLLGLRIAGDGAERRHSPVLLPAGIAGPLPSSRPPSPRVGDDQHLAGTEVFRITAGQLAGIDAENKLGSNEFPQDELIRFHNATLLIPGGKNVQLGSYLPEIY